MRNKTIKVQCTIHNNGYWSVLNDTDSNSNSKYLAVDTTCRIKLEKSGQTAEALLNHKLS